MPIYVEPGAKFDVVLKCFEDRPPGEQPTFVCVAKSAREWPKLAQMRDDANANTNEAFADALCEVIKQGLVGWRNFSSAYDADKLQDVCSIGMLVELADKLIAGQIPSPEDKKKYG